MSTGKRHRRPFRWPSYGKPRNAMLLPVIPPFGSATAAKAGVVAARMKPPRNRAKSISDAIPLLSN